MCGDEDVLRYTRVPNPVPSGWEREWLEVYEEGRRDGTREAFAVVDADDGSFLGLGLGFRDRRRRTAARAGLRRRARGAWPRRRDADSRAPDPVGLFGARCTEDRALDLRG